MKRKIVAALLAFALAFGSGAAYAASTSMTNAQKIQNLVDSKIVVGRDLDGQGKADLALDQEITRMEVATILVRLAGREELAEALNGTTEPFPDIPKNHWANGYIAASNAKGSELKPLIIGDENGNFNPDNNITYPELATMLLRVVKPDLDESNMTYPRDHVAMAGRLGILNGIESADYDKPAQRKYVFEMLYNAKAIKAGEKLGQDDKKGDEVDLYQTAINLINDYARNRTDSNKRIAEKAIEAAPAEKRAELRQKLLDAALGNTTSTGTKSEAEDAIERYRKTGNINDYAKAVESINKAPATERVSLRNKLTEAEKSVKSLDNKGTTYKDATDEISRYYRSGLNSDRNKAIDAIRRAPSKYTNELYEKLEEADRKNGRRGSYNYGYLSNDSRTREALRKIEDFERYNTTSNRNKAVDAINKAPISDRDELIRRLDNVDYRYDNRYRDYDYYYNNDYSRDVNDALRAIEDYRVKRVTYNEAKRVVDRIDDSSDRRYVEYILEDVSRNGYYSRDYYFRPYRYDDRDYDYRYLSSRYTKPSYDTTKIVNTTAERYINEYSRTGSTSARRDAIRAIENGQSSDRKYLRNLLFDAELKNMSNSSSRYAEALRRTEDYRINRTTDNYRSAKSAIGYAGDEGDILNDRLSDIERGVIR